MKRKASVLTVLEPGSQSVIPLTSHLMNLMGVHWISKTDRELAEEFVLNSRLPDLSLDVDEFRLRYLYSECLSKFPYWDLGINRRKVALEKFSQCESNCFDTNVHLASAKNISFLTTSIIEMASRKIARLLGPFSWDEAHLGFDFGPGSTTRVSKRHSDRYYKFSGIPECSSTAVPAYRALRECFPLWDLPMDPVIRDTCRIVTVPKNAKTDRVIAIEPCMNIFIQKGIGRVIRNRLRRVGVDLDDQTPNQTLAKAGSLDGSLVTIDLSSASDSISQSVVRALIPEDWYRAMQMARSSKGILPSGEIVRFQKISSMGNGFTFELESLIFWALVRSIMSYMDEGDRRLAVYGDDIVCPTSCMLSIKNVFSELGFTLNLKKTHSLGGFRESCGKHYFHGSDVTPFYVKDHVRGPDRIFLMLNHIKRWSRHEVYGLRVDLKEVYDDYLSRLPRSLQRPTIPDGYGDGGIIGDFDEVCPRKAPRGMEGWVYRHLSETRDTYIPDSPAILLKSLWSLEKRQGGCSQEMSLLPVPLPKKRVRWSKSIASQWPSFGPWQDRT